VEGSIRLLVVVADRAKKNRSSLQIDVWVMWVKQELIRKVTGRIHCFHVAGAHCGHP
jgi:hypothetical protein